MSVSGKVSALEADGMSICRLCTLVSSSKSFIPLYSDNKEELVTTKQINQLVSNLVSPDDGLPQEVCHKCVDNVSKCFKFVNNMIQAQDKLKRILFFSDVEKMNGASPRSNQFLDNESSSATNKDYGLRTYKFRSEGEISRTNSTHEMLAERRQDRNRPSIVVDKTNETGEHSHLRRLSSSTFKSLSAADFHEGDSSPPNRVFRCGICYEKFSEKENCLQHIVDNHADIRKPVSSTTIFETVMKTAASGDTNSGASATTAVAAASYRRANGVPAATSSLAEHEYSRENASGQRAPAAGKPVNVADAFPKKPLTRNRKVLAIDSFYQQIDKRCTKYICDNCGRMMMSRFAFQRHLHDHETPPVSKASEKRPASRPPQRPVPRGVRKHCNVCRRNVRDGLRHRMYHTIVELETQFPSSACMLLNSV